MLNTSAVPPSIGGMFVAQAADHVPQYTGSYVPPFGVGAYRLAVFMHLILPRRRRDIIASAVPAQ